MRDQFCSLSIRTDRRRVALQEIARATNRVIRVRSLRGRRAWGEIVIVIARRTARLANATGRRRRAAIAAAVYAAVPATALAVPAAARAVVVGSARAVANGIAIAAVSIEDASIVSAVANWAIGRHVIANASWPSAAAALAAAASVAAPPLGAAAVRAATIGAAAAVAATRSTEPSITSRATRTGSAASDSAERSKRQHGNEPFHGIPPSARRTRRGPLAQVLRRSRRKNRATANRRVRSEQCWIAAGAREKTAGRATAVSVELVSAAQSAESRKSLATRRPTSRGAAEVVPAARVSDDLSPQPRRSRLGALGSICYKCRRFPTPQ